MGWCHGMARKSGKTQLADAEWRWMEKKRDQITISCPTAVGRGARHQRNTTQVARWIDTGDLW